MSLVWSRLCPTSNRDLSIELAHEHAVHLGVWHYPVVHEHRAQKAAGDQEDSRDGSADGGQEQNGQNLQRSPKEEPGGDAEVIPEHLRNGQLANSCYLTERGGGD